MNTLNVLKYEDIELSFKPSYFMLGILEDIQNNNQLLVLRVLPLMGCTMEGEGERCLLHGKHVRIQ